jgi:hypothetical protein
VLTFFFNFWLTLRLNLETRYEELRRKTEGWHYEISRPLFTNSDV